MQRFAIVSVCLLCEAFGRRERAASRRPRAQRHDSENLEARFSDVQRLALRLLALKPDSGFHPSFAHRTPRQSRISHRLRSSEASMAEEQQASSDSSSSVWDPVASSRSALDRVWKAAATPLAMLAFSFSVFSLNTEPALAENELAALANGKFDSSLVDTACMKDKCLNEITACGNNVDCVKGMTCVGKCMGDNACVTGCFSKFSEGTGDVSGLLKCTVEENECIKINVLPAGWEMGDKVTPPRGTQVKNFEPGSMAGSWYKVMGWNSNYDCFDCQQNKFAQDKKTGDWSMEVEFSMPRPTRYKDGKEAAPARIQRAVEEVVFENKNPLRHGRTEGHLFGLTFWENWSVIGQNKKGEPDFKFIYYNGKTRQNTYEGAFVYARTASLSRNTMKDVYRIARNAGLEPDSFCQIRNGGDVCSATSDAPTQLASKIKPPAMPANFLDFTGAVRTPLELLRGTSQKMNKDVSDVAEWVEDPKPSSQWMHDQQRPVDWGSIPMAFAEDIDPKLPKLPKPQVKVVEWQPN